MCHRGRRKLFVIFHQSDPRIWAWKLHYRFSVRISMVRLETLKQIKIDLYMHLNEIIDLSSVVTFQALYIAKNVCFEAFRYQI